MNDLRAGVLPEPERGLTLAEAGVVLGKPGRPLTARRVGQLIASGLLRRGWKTAVRLDAQQMPWGRLIFAHHLAAFFAAIEAQARRPGREAAREPSRSAATIQRIAQVNMTDNATPTYPDARTFGRRSKRSAGRHAGAPGQDGHRSPDTSPVSGGAPASSQRSVSVVSQPLTSSGGVPGGERSTA